jgi:RNA polymerase sigma-70 factor (ECF subfamily)
MNEHPPRMPPPHPDAFRAIFEENVAYMWATLRFLGVRPADLEDVTHEAFLTVHRLLPQFDASRPLRPWLFTIAHHAALGHRRRAHHQREVLTEPDEQVDEGPGADEVMARKQDLALVEEALACLDDDRRAVLLMVDMADHSAPEAAAALGVPLNTIYSRLRRGRDDFAQALVRLRKKRGEHGL